MEICVLPNAMQKTEAKDTELHKLNSYPALIISLLIYKRDRSVIFSTNGALDKMHTSFHCLRLFNLFQSFGQSNAISPTTINVDE
jgi:hypothetical protein